MGRMVDGQWVTEQAWADGDGRFVRSPTVFRGEVPTDDPARFRLYVSYACPWAHRTLMVRARKGLNLDVCVVHPLMSDDGWDFSPGDGVVPDPEGATLLREVYLRAAPDYTGRVTVPILWDKQAGTIANNESREIIEILDNMPSQVPRLFPPEHRKAIDDWIDGNYESVNNGVYKSGFATSQAAYHDAVTTLFKRLDVLEEHLASNRFLCGDGFTAADICLFTTLVRFDPVYHYHFKCNLRRLRDYPNLWRHTRAIYQMRGVADTCRMDHIKQHYYASHRSINPSGVVPDGPEIDFDEPVRWG